MRRTLFLLTCLLLTTPLAAQNPPKLEPLPEPPPPPAADQARPAVEEQGLEPEVTIRADEKGQKVEEYRVQGKLYMVKITPKSGPAYYLIDRDGDGSFETKHTDMEQRIAVPKWVLKRW